MEEDRIVFYSKSAAGPPGKNKGQGWAERWTANIPEDLRTGHWRRLLSNFDDSVPFEFMGFHFNTIEHAFQWAKINMVDPLKAYTFTRESGSPLGMGPGSEAQKKRKMVLLSKEQMDAWDTISLEVMRKATFAKYLQNKGSLPAQILVATGNAELYHLVTTRGKPSQLVRFHHLEEIRDTLNAL
jgi:predicted NAD-dependent protein-ADP-ribosyltransferase YbiA (DUF1768 family)